MNFFLIAVTRVYEFNVGITGGEGGPGCMGINRNEIAHQLPMLETSLPLIEPEPALDICEGCRRSNEGLDEQDERGILQYIHGQRQPKGFLKDSVLKQLGNYSACAGTS